MLPLVIWSLIASSSNAAAATLELRWTSPVSTAPVSFVYQDVKPGPPPGMIATGPDGVDYLIHLTLDLPTPTGADRPKVVVDARVRELKADRRGRAYVRMLVAPRLETDVGTTASVFQGSQMPVEGSNPVAWKEVGLKLEVTYRDAPAAPVTP
jgi:hypothetical protein